MATENCNILPNWHDEEDIDAMNEDEFSEFLFAKLESETEPALTLEDSKTIDGFISDSGSARRVLLAFLSKPWKEIRDNAVKEDNFAKALAEVCSYSHASRYEHIASLLKNAEVRMMAALACREDFNELLNQN